MLALLPTMCSHILIAFALFASTGVSKCEIRNQGGNEDCILRLNATLDWLMFNDRAKTKLAKLAFLYCGEIVKTL